METVIQVLRSDDVHWSTWLLLALMAVTIVYVMWSLYKNPSDEPNKAGYLVGALLCGSVTIAMVSGTIAWFYRNWHLMFQSTSGILTTILATCILVWISAYAAKEAVMSFKKYRQFSQEN